MTVDPEDEFWNGVRATWPKLDAWLTRKGVSTAPVTPDVPTDPPDPSRLAPRNVVATVSGTTATVTWDAPLATVGQPNHYLVGRNGKDATGSGPWEQPATLLDGARGVNLDKLVPGQTYQVHVTAVWNNPVTEYRVEVTVAIPPAPAPAAGKNASGLPFKLLAFNDGGLTKANLDALAAKAGVPVLDGGLTFMAWGSGAKDWNALKDDNLAKAARAILDVGGTVVISVPFGPGADPGMLAKAAKGDLSAEYRAWAAWAVSRGLNHPRCIWRPGWEGNGNWYPWQIANGGPAVFKAALGVLVDQLRAGGLTLIEFDLCLNMPSSGSSASWFQLDPGGKRIKYYSVDQYDAYPAVRTHADWEAKQADIHSVRGAMAAARAASTADWTVLACVDECGNWHTKDGAGDNPQYYVELVGELARDPGRVGWLSLFNSHGNPPNLFHGADSNPAAYAKLREVLGRLRAA